MRHATETGSHTRNNCIIPPASNHASNLSTLISAQGFKRTAQKIELMAAVPSKAEARDPYSSHR